MAPHHTRAEIRHDISTQVLPNFKIKYNVEIRNHNPINYINSGDTRSEVKQPESVSRESNHQSSSTKAKSTIGCCCLLHTVCLPRDIVVSHSFGIIAESADIVQIQLLLWLNAGRVALLLGFSLWFLHGFSTLGS